MSSFENQTDQLFAVAPDEFVSARKVLAKRLRAEGDKAAATRVAKLRRPTVTAWALNQVARSRPDLVEVVLSAGEGVRRAVNEAVRGDRSGMRAAEAAVREAVARAVESASSVLEDAGRPATASAAQHIATTLSSAVRDEAVAARLRAGRLEADHDVAGFGPDLDSLPVAAPRVDREGEKGRDDPSEDGEDPGVERPAATPTGSADLAGESERAERRAEKARLAEQARRLDREAERSRQDAARLSREADEAERTAREARTAAVTAEEQATTAAEAATAAARALAAFVD